MEVELKKATMEDAIFLLELRNEPSVRAQSFDTNQIALAQHIHWLERRLLLAPPHLYVIYDAQQRPVGSCRIDVDDAGRAGTVGISLLPAHRGRGLGLLALQSLQAQAVSDARLSRLIAYVRSENEASLKLFRNAGYAGPIPAVPDSLDSSSPPEPCSKFELVLVDA